MSKSSPSLTARAQGAFFGGFTWLVRVLPAGAGLKLMAGLGSLGAFLLGQRRRTAEGRIAQALGLPPGGPECRRIARGSCRTMARGIFESWWIDGIEARHPGRVAIDVTGIEHVRRARAEGRGVLLVPAGGWLSSWLRKSLGLAPLEAMGVSATLAQPELLELLELLGPLEPLERLVAKGTTILRCCNLEPMSLRW